MTPSADNLVKELTGLVENDPVGALRRVSELDETPNGRSAAGTILIECGRALGDLSSISLGIETLEALLQKISFNSDIAYNMANGLVYRAQLAAANEPSFRGQAADDRFRARVLFGRVVNDPSASPETRSQMLTNVGILFLETHRWVEALDCFQHAQDIFPTNAVAAYQEMQRLMLLANLFLGEEQTYQSYCHLDALGQRARQLATRISNNYDTFEHLTGNPVPAEVHEAVRNVLEIDEVPQGRIDDPYYSFISRNNLALSLHCSAKEFASGRFDFLTIPHLHTTMEDGPNVPELYAMINVLKADFAFARQVFFEVYEDDADIPYYETTSHGDTLDYAVYGVRFSALTTAQRIAFDILDKIAVAIACYLGLPHAHRKSFKDIWGKPQKGEGFVFSGELEAKLINRNQPLMALFNIYQDIFKADGSESEGLDIGFMAAQRQYRNSSTHRFTVLHDFGRGYSSRSCAIDHKDLREFEQLTLSSLKLARAALFYFVDFIVFEERGHASDEGDIVISSTVPDHDYIRGRKE